MAVLFRRRARWKTLGFVLLLLAIVPAAAAVADPAPVLPPGLSPGGAGRAVAVVDGDTLVLDDGRQVRLVGIQAPKLPLGRPGFRAWPLAGEAKAALVALAQGRSLRLAFGGQRIDRYGRVLAHLQRVDDDLWLQGELLRRGLARVYSFRDNRAAVPEMLQLERAARAAGRGIWSDPWYAVLTPDEAGRHLDSFQLVEGVVRRAAVVRGRLYLNFGADWRRDFTVSVGPADLRLFDAAGFPAPELEGRRLRVRGWLREYNGPLIEATHPEQIELLAPPGG
ncbi:MAG TPA: thermonuclease family protein [Alphaproteobacteria bacterium]|nr:thermonuclease family protein [Alphaproteobacteria bacterium]